jgi:PAS domain S-box-containing protein
MVPTPDEVEFLQQLVHERDTLKQENQALKNQLEAVDTKSSGFQDLIKHAADAIFLGDPQGNITTANLYAFELTAYPQEELIGMNISRLFPANELQRAPLRYDLLQAGETVHQQRELLRKSGDLISIEMSARVLPDGTYHCFMRDISDRKKIEEALRHSEEKFSRAFKLSPDAVNINRLRDGAYIEINEGFTKAMGWTEEEVIGRTSLPGDLDIWCRAEDRQKLVDGLRANGEVHGLQAPFRSKEGRILIGLMSARLIEINGEPCILSITRDITERVQAEEERRKLEEQMLQVQKLESLGVLAGGIAHDFNNILLAVLGHCELAQRRFNDPTAVANHLLQIKNAAGKAANLANQMLAYSGKGKFVVAPLNLSRLVAEMEQILAVSVSKKAVLRYELAEDLPTVEADATQLHQVIMNLVINASESIGDNSGVIAVVTGVMDCDTQYLSETWLDEHLPEGRYVYVEVADTGCGMDPDQLDRIFEPFYSTKFTGRGLGMAAVLGIVRGHQGAIKLYTEAGKGSTFKVLLPASTMPETPVDNIDSNMSFNPGGLVLLVDDEETILEIGKEMLEELGFEVLTAHDGLAAVELFRRHHRDIRFVLMDLTMPYMDGEQAYREFRRITKEVEVIICSGYNQQEVAQKFVGKGLAGFLKKPYQFSELIKAIKQLDVG